MGIYFIVFVMKEPSREKHTTEQTNADNCCSGIASQDDMAQIAETDSGNASSSPLGEKDNRCFPRKLPVVHIIFRKRKNGGRAILVLLFFLYFVALGPAYGEGPNEYNFTRLQLNWGVVAYVYYATFTNTLELIGTTIMMTLFKKWLKLADASIGAISCALGCVTRILFVNIYLLMFVGQSELTTRNRFRFSFTQRHRSCFTSLDPLTYSLI